MKCINQTQQKKIIIAGFWFKIAEKYLEKKMGKFLLNGIILPIRLKNLNWMRKQKNIFKNKKKRSLERFFYALKTKP